MVNLSKRQIMLGIFEKRSDFKVINHSLILAKQTIFHCRQKKLTPNIMLFLTRLKHVIEIEKTIAANKNKTLVHLEKWNKILSFVLPFL